MSEEKQLKVEGVAQTKKDVKGRPYKRVLVNGKWFTCYNMEVVAGSTIIVPEFKPDDSFLNKVRVVEETVDEPSLPPDPEEEEHHAATLRESTTYSGDDKVLPGEISAANLISVRSRCILAECILKEANALVIAQKRKPAEIDWITKFYKACALELLEDGTSIDFRERAHAVFVDSDTKEEGEQ